MTETYKAVELKEFQNHLYNRMNEFRLKNHLCDVNINVNGKIHPCHRVVLTAASPLIESRLAVADDTVQNSDPPVLTIDEVEGSALEEIFNAIYSSRLRLLPENVYFILKASHFLQIDVIKNACVVWIMKNTDIHYLIDVCLFAKSIKEEKLYRKCVETVSQDILRWSSTDSFKDVPFNVLNDILAKCNTSKIEELTLLMIIKWSKYNKVNWIDIQSLLDSAKLKGKIVSTSIMSKLIFNSDDDVFAIEKAKTTSEETESNSQFDFNVCVNGVDVKTGVNGWGVMKINDTFKECAMSDFRFTNSKLRKIVKIETKQFCFETKNDGKNAFSCFDECYNKTALNLPDDDVFSSFDVAAVDDKIYLVKTDSSVGNDIIWMYDCEVDSWSKAFEQEFKEERQKSRTNCYKKYCSYCGRYSDSNDDTCTRKHKNYISSGNTSYGYGCETCRGGGYCKIEYETCTEMKPALHTYKNHSRAFTSSDGILYVITEDSNNTRVILSFDSRSPKVSILTKDILFDTRNAAVCLFDNKIALSGSSDGNVLSNSFNIFDITAKKWLPDIKPMNFSRANHNLFHHDGFLYAVENNQPVIPNEKYDMKSKEWTNIPALPKRILVDNTNEVMVVSTADVLGVHVNPTRSS